MQLLGSFEVGFNYCQKTDLYVMVTLLICFVQMKIDAVALSLAAASCIYLKP